MTFESIDAWWWPYLFIVIAGALATDIWRWIGVVAGGSLRDDSEALIWVKAVATALVAGVISQLILFPSGAVAEVHLAFRIAAAAIGWLAFWFARRSVTIGVLVGEFVLLVGWFLRA